jgi:hypothetical protein
LLEMLGQLCLPCRCHAFMLREGVARNAVDRSILPQSPIAVVVPITDAIWGVYHRPS